MWSSVDGDASPFVLENSALGAVDVFVSSRKVGGDNGGK